MSSFTFLRVAPLALSLCSLACATSDLRPGPEPFPPTAEAEGRAWLGKAVEAQGGAALSAHRTASLTMHDEWPGWFFRAVAMPWPGNGVKMRLDARLGTDDGRLTFLEGEAKGSGWGIQSWVTYRFDADGNLAVDAVDDADDDIKFWIPTTLYFPFMAWRLQEATVIRAMGPEEIGGRTYQRVFATWGTAEPQDDIDQYVLYIDAETHRIRWAQYTVRDVAGFAVGLMSYEDYKTFGDLTLPTSLRVVEDFDATETGLHRYVLHDVVLDPKLPEGWLTPRPELKANK